MTPLLLDGYREYAFFPEDDRRPPGRLGGRRPHRGRSRLGQVPHRTALLLPSDPARGLTADMVAALHAWRAAL
ncbi:hypothetical protein [Streptomyces albidoflavus]|uniref:hypothetical protein n=1 Tax=Streptomyces albidoflavus TaxID=1886 RepID=UPI00341CD6F5